MRNVLIYIEPHPIRNYYEEFHDVGLLLSQAMLRAGHKSGYDFRYISNDAVVDRIITNKPQLSYLALRLTADENEKLNSLYGQWNLATVNQWLSLVKGEGEVTDFYVSVLARLHKEYPFDAVVLWSDNGAVRRFCKKNDIVVMHVEYGPTRAPFHQTIYFDPEGTNGAASVLNAPLDSLKPTLNVPRETWVTRHGKSWNDDKKVGLIDAPSTMEPNLVESGCLPMPYAFIPLQLEDDLNTQLYSQFKTPEAFLRHVLPQILASGLNVVIKGHPGAMGRTFNLIAETKALNYARSLGDRITILPKSITPFQSIHIISQAAAIVTINSSVGFEALLLGKKTFLYGAATYDIGGHMDATNTDFSTNEISKADHAHLDKLTSFLCNHYLHPLESVTTGNALPKVLDYFFETKKKANNTAEFWQGWIDNINFGYRWLADIASDLDELQPTKDIGSLAGNRAMFEANSRTFSLDGEDLFMIGKQGDYRVKAHSKCTRGNFAGFLESVEETDVKGNKYLLISGWCVDRDYRPPTQVFFCENNKVVSTHRILSVRRDVSETLGKSIAPCCGFTFHVDAKYINSTKECSLIFLSSANNSQITPLAVGSIHQTT